VYQQIKTADFDFPDEWWGGVSEAAKQLIRELLVVDPAKRLTVNQALNSAWMNSGNSKKGSSKTTRSQAKETKNEEPATGRNQAQKRKGEEVPASSTKRRKAK